VGFLRKITGVQAQIDATRRQADAEIANTKAVSENAALAANSSAEAAASAASQNAARQQALDAAAKAQQQPMAQADVLLETPTVETATASARRRKAQFGNKTYSSGVNI
jgi:DNA-binding helix-hairpin-helix protein with protein kinase domain